MMQINREHEICMGHRVYGHESKCKNLHGHNYKFEFVVRPKISLDSIGRVTDFSEIKSVLCEWLENNWDHKMMLWNEDPLYETFQRSNYFTIYEEVKGVISVPFNPTAENIANYFLNTIAMELCQDKSWYLYSVNLHETGKCSAYVSLTWQSEKIIKQFNAVAPLVPMPPTYACNKQAGDRRECLCEGKSDRDKIDCRYCVSDLPF